MAITFLKKFRKEIFAFLIFIFLAVTFTYPAVLHFKTDLIGDGGDTIEFLSYLYLFRQQVDSHQLPFSWTTIYRYPHGFNFEQGSDARLFVILGGLLLPSLGDVLTYNLLIIAILTLNGYFSWLFFRELTGSFWLGILGGTIFGLSYQILVRTAGHVNLMQVYAIPFICLIALRIVKRKTVDWKNAILLTLGFLLLALSTLQYVLIFMAVLIFTAPFCLLFLNKEFSFVNLHFLKKSLPKLGVALLIGLFLAYCLFPDHLSISSAEYLKRAESVARRYWSPPARVDSYFFPNPYLIPLLFKPIMPFVAVSASLDNSLFLGYIELISFFLALIYLPKKKLFTFTFWWCALFFLLPLGKSWNIVPFLNIYDSKIWPFYLIFDWQRFFIFFYFIFTCVIVLGLKQLGLDKKKWLVVLVLCGLCLERMSFNFFHVPILNYRGKPYEIQVAKIPGKAVFDIPIVLNLNFVPNALYNLLPFTYQKSSIQGFFNWPAHDSMSEMLLDNETFGRFYCIWPDPKNNVVQYNIEENQHLLDRMRELQITTLVIHKQIFYDNTCLTVRKRTAFLVGDLTEDEAQINSEPYEDIDSAQQNLSRHLLRVYADEDAIVYQVN